MTSWTVVHGRVEDALARGDLGRFDAVFSDPPYGINFMGHGWDRGVPGREIWGMVRAHIYPGSHVVAFGGTRTWHRLAVAMEDAGLEMRDSLLAWMYGQGWPKPADVSKYVDRALGATRGVVGTRSDGARNKTSSGATTFANTCDPVYAVTAPGSHDGAIWQGWHGNLAPSWEPALVFREPGGTYASNALEHGVSGLHVDGARIGDTKRVPGSISAKNGAIYGRPGTGNLDPNRSGNDPSIGRWPSNAMLCCEEAICGDGPHRPGCPVYEMDAQGGVTVSSARPRRNSAAAHTASPVLGSSSANYTTGGHEDSGGASRFFYVAKVSRGERGESAHPCMKPLALCRQIAALLLQPPIRPRRLLVPFSGSGSEMIGALQAGWDEVVGIEEDEKWCALSRARIEREVLAWQEAQGKVSARQARKADRPVQIGLFAEDT